MNLGQILYALGLIVVFFSGIFTIVTIFSDNGLQSLPFIFFAILNGLIAMGIGELVMNMHQNK